MAARLAAVLSCCGLHPYWYACIEVLWLQDRLRQCQEQESTWANEKAQLKAGLAAALDQKASAEGDLAALREHSDTLQCQVSHAHDPLPLPIFCNRTAAEVTTCLRTLLLQAARQIKSLALIQGSQL